MSLQSVVLFDGEVNFDTFVSGGPLAPPHDVGFVAPWYLIAEGVTILTTETGTPPFLTSSVAGASMITKLDPADDFSFLEGIQLPPQEIAVGPSWLKVTGTPGRVFTLCFEQNGADFHGMQHVKVTLYYFKDTGLLASN